ncbi:hypothetical protein [Aeromonas allosaccharophila]|uniref:hypothetical protein n=1 Tax=Aeromonas TaxID=642 RepID=UPI0030074C93
MARKTQRNTLTEDEIRIINVLKNDFVSKGRSSIDLKNGYDGVPITDLCSGSSLGNVEFDLALDSLDRDGFIKSGPLCAFDNEPGSSVIIIGMYSKKEYYYLTAYGYQAKTQRSKERLVPKSTHQTNIFNAPLHGVQIASGTYSEQNMTVNQAESSPAIEAIIRALESQGIVINDEVHANVSEAVAAAERGDSSSIKKVLNWFSSVVSESAKSSVADLIKPILLASLDL